MPQLTPVVLNDSQAAPVTFSPLGISQGIASLAARTSGKPALDKGLTLSSRKQPNGAYRVTAKMTLPVLETDSQGQEQVIDNTIVDITVRCPGKSDLTARQDARTFIKALAEDTVFTALVDNLEGMY